MSADVVHVWGRDGQVVQLGMQLSVDVQLARPPQDALHELTHVWFSAQPKVAPLQPAQLGIHAPVEAQK